MRKLTPEEREQLQAMLDKQDVEKAEKEQRLLKRNVAVRRMLRTPRANAQAGRINAQAVNDQTSADLEFSSLTSKGQELIAERKKRTGRGPGLKQMKLTEEEKRELAARIRGDK